MRTPTKMELSKIAEIKKYTQPRCPGCQTEMQLCWGSSALRENYFLAFYRCANNECIGRWSTGYQSSLNAAHAVEDAYKAAMLRKEREITIED